jgi:hypothetical protein
VVIAGVGDVTNPRYDYDGARLVIGLVHTAARGYHSKLELFSKPWRSASATNAAAYVLQQLVADALRCGC